MTMGALRPATLDDAEMLFAWRNDPLTREASVNTDVVTWKGHLAWLRASLENPKRRLLVAETENPVGTVRIDYGDETEISWTVAPGARGKGIGTEKVKGALPEGPLIACIKRANIASQQIAKAAGFVLVSDHDLQRWKRG
jgi:RimJ/RimL family protein N-acetyltransferase